MKPKIFIGSSSESLIYAYGLQKQLAHKADVEVWSQGVFDLNRSYLETLTTMVGEVDFGVFIFAPDDMKLIRDKSSPAVRDNVLFEFGLFLGGLGRNRTFFVTPRGASGLELPTDLLGISTVQFDSEAANIEAALGAASFHILQAISRFGIRQERLAAPEVETSANPRILCACSAPYFDLLSFEKNVHIIRTETQKISSRIVEAHKIGAKGLKDILMENSFEIIHLATFVDPKTGNLRFDTLACGEDPDPKNETDRISAEGFAELVRIARARLVILASCDSLTLAAKLARDTNMVAALDWVGVDDLLDWELSFYKCLSKGASVSSAYETAKVMSKAPMLLLLKKDIAFTN